MVAALLRAVPSAVALAAPAAVIAEVHWLSADEALVLAVFAVPWALDAAVFADAAFVMAVEALVLAVLAVDAVAAAAVLTFDKLLPVDEPPANA